jgi:hypothetical protein
MTLNLTEQDALERVKTEHPDPLRNRFQLEEWIALPYETRYRLLREATEHYIDKRESSLRNPDPKVCPFIARHSVGYWSMGGDDFECWECICGYVGKTKNWQKHEQSKRHQDWTKHRAVSNKKIEKMKAKIYDDERGTFFRYARLGTPSDIYPGGIRVYSVSQERNEWTNPEMFYGMNRMENVEETWFVHPRNIRTKDYVIN